LFHFEAKITISKQSEKFVAKKANKSEKKRKKRKKAKKNEKTKKSEKKAKKVKKSEKIDLNFASLCFTSKEKLPK
jgi:hypothetical protein